MQIANASDRSEITAISAVHSVNAAPAGIINMTARRYAAVVATHSVDQTWRLILVSGCDVVGDTERPLPFAM